MKSSDTTQNSPGNSKENVQTRSQDNPLGYEKESKLLVGFAIPCIISMLVTALYNIVDQIFIGQGVGMLGNAATNIAFRFRPPARRFLFYSESAVPPTFHSTSVPVKKTNPQNTQETACALWQFSESAFSF